VNDGRVTGGEILVVARPEMDSAAALDRLGAEAIEFQFVGPARVFRQFLGALKEHGFDEAGFNFDVCHLRTSLPQCGRSLQPMLDSADLLIMTDVERSHAELRAALRLAGRRITPLNFGRRDDPVLTIMRRVWRDSRAVARASRSARGNEVATRPLVATDITAYRFLAAPWFRVQVDLV